MPRQLLDLGGNGGELVRTCCVDCLDQVVEVETEIMGVSVSQAVGVSQQDGGHFHRDHWPGVVTMRRACIWTGEKRAEASSKSVVMFLESIKNHSLSLSFTGSATGVGRWPFSCQVS